MIVTGPDQTVSIAGGSLAALNARPITVSNLAYPTPRLVAGTHSHGRPLPVQSLAATFFSETEPVDVFSIFGP